MLMPAGRILEGRHDRHHELEVGALVEAEREGSKSMGLDTYGYSCEGTAQFSLAVEISEER